VTSVTWGVHSSTQNLEWAPQGPPLKDHQVTTQGPPRRTTRTCKKDQQELHWDLR